MTLKFLPDRFCLTAHVELSGRIRVQRKQFIQFIAARGNAGQLHHRAIMRRKLLRRDRPVGNVGVAIRHHGRTPDRAQAAEGERGRQPDARSHQPEFPLRVAIRIIRAEQNFLRNARRAGIHAFFDPRQILRAPLLRSLLAKALDDLRAFRFEAQSGIEHQHVAPAMEERRRARHTGRTGTDNTIHKSFAVIALREERLQLIPPHRSPPAGRTKLRRKPGQVARSTLICSRTFKAKMNSNEPAGTSSKSLNVGNPSRVNVSER